MRKKKFFWGLMTNLKKSGKKLETETVINMLFTQERFGTQHGEMLNTIDGPFQLVHADLVDLHFFNKSAAAPKHCLVCLSMFTLKTYMYSVKQKSQLRNKLEAFYEETDNKRSYLKKENRHHMRLQTDQEFNQNEIKVLNDKFNVEHFNSKLNAGHAEGAEQKIRELKGRLRNFKSIKKSKNLL